MSRALALAALGAMLVLSSPVLGRTLLDKNADERAACYEDCMEAFGWDPVCAYSPLYPEPTVRLPSATWVMPNNCTVTCEMEYAKYKEYFELDISGPVEGLPAGCSKDASTINAIYFEYSDQSESADTCRKC